MANFKKLAYHKTSIEFENALDALYPQQADRVRSISVAYLEAYRPTPAYHHWSWVTNPHRAFR
jgi:hypothetical protein